MVPIKNPSNAKRPYSENVKRQALNESEVISSTVDGLLVLLDSIRATSA